MELFDKNGHLTGEGLRAVTDGGLSELERLEASEHLGFCDDCLTRYLALLESGTLAEPRRGLVKPVLRRLRQGIKRRMWIRWGGMAAAACLALAIFGVGGALLGGARGDGTEADGQAGFVQRFNEGMANVVDNTRGFVSGLLAGEDADTQASGDTGGYPKPPEPPEPKQVEPPEPTKPPAGYGPVEEDNTRAERDALFDGGS